MTKQQADSTSNWASVTLVGLLSVVIGWGLRTNSRLLVDHDTRIHSNSISIGKIDTRIIEDDRRITESFTRVEAAQAKMDGKLDIILEKLPR